MAKRSTGAATVDLNTLLVQAQTLRERIAAIDMIIANLKSAVAHVEAAVKTLDAVNESDEVLVPTDAGFNSMMFVKVKDKDKVLYHVGGDVYAVIPREKAEELLLNRLSKLTKALNEAIAEKESMTRHLAEIEYILQIALAQAQSAPQRK